MPLASEGIRLLTQPTSNFILPSTFQEGGVQVNATANDTARNEGQVRQLTAQEDRTARTVTFRDSYDVLTPPTSARRPTAAATSRA